MKKLLALIAAAVTTSSLFAQGTVNINNYSRPNPADGRILLNGSTTAGPNSDATGTGSQFKVQLFGGTASGNQTLITGTSTSPWIGSGTSSGYFDLGIVSVPGIAAGSTAVLSVKVFDGASYGAGTQIGTSGNYTVTLGTPANGATPPNPSTGFQSQFGGFTLSLVPEPTTLAMGLLAGAGLLALRRRK